MHPDPNTTQKYWHELFEFGVFIKGFNGVWEIVSGFMILFLSKITLTNWFFLIAQNELLEDPRDKFINFLVQTLQNFSSSTQILVALYILTHGLLNIFLAVQLYRDKHWAYLVTIGATLMFMSYQIYRISIHHSLILTIITIFDMFFIILAWHEYKYHRDRLKIKS